jgi:hypothetical protein
MIIAERTMGRDIGNLSFTAPNSRAIADIYSLSHIIHGFVLYYIFCSFLPLSYSLIIATIIEVSWEIVENSYIIINRYRRTVAKDYVGDTVVNSVNDVMFMIAGFYTTWLLPVWSILLIITVLELLALWYRSDNLTLNIIMLIYPFEKIKRWQVERINKKKKNYKKEI